MKRIIKQEREEHRHRENFFDVGRNSAGRVLLFLIAILFFLRLQPQAGTPQSRPRQSNRLIVLVG